MDEVIIYCPNCQQKMSCPIEYEGKKFTCPTCGQSLMLTDVTEKAANDAQDQMQQVPAPPFQDIFTTARESDLSNASPQMKKNEPQELKILPHPPKPSSIQKSFSGLAICAYVLGGIAILLLVCLIPVLFSRSELFAMMLFVLVPTCIAMFVTGILFAGAAELLEHQRQTSFYTKKLYELMWKKEHKDK